MGHLRGGVVLLLVATLTCLLIPLQWLCVRLAFDFQKRLPHFYHSLICRVIGVRLRQEGSPAEKRPLLLVANHLSWLDISVFSACAPISFVAKAEVEKWPVVGLLARLQRSVFVDRQRRQQTKRVGAEIGMRLKKKDVLLLFPEGTSGDGGKVLPFRSALMGAALQTLFCAETADSEQSPQKEAWVQPVALTYTHLHGMPLGFSFRPHIAWYGEMRLLPHLWRLLKRGGIDVTVSWGAPVCVTFQTNRKHLAILLRKNVQDLLDSVNRRSVGRDPAPFRISSLVQHRAPL